MLQMLHHHPHPKEIQNYRTKWLQACGSNVCGHETIWKTGAGPPEGHHWTRAGSSSVCLQSKQVCGRCSQHETALCSATSRQTRVLCESLVQPSLLSKNCTHPEWPKRLVKSLWTLHIQHTPSLNCYRLVDATELWAPERPDTETVSSLRQSISWTLDNNYGTH